MPTRLHPNSLINAFLRDAQAAQEKIIERSLPEPNDDAETRILKAFTRDMQLICINAAGALAKLPAPNAAEKGVVLLARSMLQGVAAITSPFTEDNPEAIKQFTDFLRRAMEHSHATAAFEDEEE